MNLTHRVRLWVLLCVTAAAPMASAQDTSPGSAIPPPPAHVSSLDGDASLERDGVREPASAGIPLIAGDRLRTEAGRLEILYTDGSALHLDQSTTADLLAPDLIRLTAGRVYLVVAGSRDPSRAVRYQIDAPAASVLTSWPGQYRIAATDGSVELAVVSGEATLATDLGAQIVRAGERAWAGPDEPPSRPEYFNSARWDPFDRWSAARRDERVGTVSARYLPADLSVYGGTFDRHGTWRVEPSIGYVWYPAVAADWRPYYDGYWQPSRSWGSVWIGSDPWGYPTHHYGRWGFSGHFGWYWIPDRVWGPGWVYWGTTSGYVSWCAIGFHGGPVFGQWGLRGAAYTSRLDPWRGWTVVPRHVFGQRRSVARHAVDGRRLDPHERDRFVASRTAPPTQYAVPRSGVGDRPAADSARRPGGLGPASSVPSARASADTGPVRRYGRADGTGVSRQPEPDLAGRTGAARWRGRPADATGASAVPAAPRRDLSGAPTARRDITGDGRAAPATPDDRHALYGRRAVPPSPNDRSALYGRRAVPPSPNDRSAPYGRRAVPEAPRSPWNATPSQVVGSRPTPSEVIRSRPTPSDTVGVPARRGSTPSYRATPPAYAPGRERAPAYQDRSGGGRRQSSEPRPSSPARSGVRDGGPSREAPPPRYNPGSGNPRGGAPSSGQARRRPPGDP